MMWEMQVLVGATVNWVDGEEKVEGGEWQSVHPAPILGCKTSPYRYEVKEDAEVMLERLYPDVHPLMKKVVRV